MKRDEKVFLAVVVMASCITNSNQKKLSEILKHRGPFMSLIWEKNMVTFTRKEEKY